MYDELKQELTSYYKSFAVCGDKKSKIAQLLIQSVEAIESLERQIEVKQKKKIMIVEVWPARGSNEDCVGIGVDWDAEGIGFGQLALYFEGDGKIHADTEHMCDDEHRGFLRDVLIELSKQVVIDG
jgi:hypothetical protein